ncbi:phospholipid-transporting ATPase IC [Erpetoichthys calabaricus]|uniref:phospholipid-transporting ATPase IC n=1 Tax=Erpetoichthys calabaricus TaxID=27687 RepID=UPI0022349E84|nr:phospholipid-transporting ATPase IC [Erpetoichthys calabaricus]
MNPQVSSREPSLGPKHRDTTPEYTWEVRANSRGFRSPFNVRFPCLRRRGFSNNTIKTCKYNILTFLPLNLFEQFQRVANFYFLLIVILQSVPAISTLPWYTTMLPLLTVLFVRAAKDISDDLARRRSDKEINTRPCDILQGGSFKAEQWRHIHVGDIVRIRKDQIIPADLLLLASTEPHSLCYVETADIDGETNLKYRQALHCTHSRLQTEGQLSDFDGLVTCEEPNSLLHSFSGTLHWMGEQYPLSNDRILLRGFRLRNTHTCYGLVLFAGPDCKIMRNCGLFTVKKTQIEILLNRIVILILTSLAVTATLLAVGCGVWDARKGRSSEFIAATSRGDSSLYMGFLTFWGYIIILSPVMPMSLYITFEFIHVVHSLFIDWDLDMYFIEKDTPARARNTALNEQLGQIEFLFSDKTGTLTQNILTFKKCCVSGVIYGNKQIYSETTQPIDLQWNPFADGKLSFSDQVLVDRLRSGEDRSLTEFFRVLAVCHTVMAEEVDGDLRYQAASPDEEALVTAARNFGFVFMSRTQDSVTVSELGKIRVYDLLAILDFSSQRRRMSVLVREPSGKIKLFCKGADIVIFERLETKCLYLDATEKALEEFAKDSLRTLCLASKNVPEEFYQSWSKEFLSATMAMQNKEAKLEAVYEKMEQELTLLGATAIEDKLQDGVPDTIHILKKGGIKIWMLTGDKQETAVNIGYSCKLLDNNMEILEGATLRDLLWTPQINNNTSGLKNEEWLNSHLKNMQATRQALVITGQDLDEIFQQDSQIASCTKQAGILQHFVELASKCETVICCRVTPLQKANVVEAVKRQQKAITLAIGDGANDVNMIKRAHIGIGISGQEGLQAVQCSDFSLAQFRYLQRLLLVHGRWSYLRVCKFLNYFLFKTFSFSFVHIWFSFFNGFTSQPAYENWFITLYTVMYTSLPVLSMALLDQDVSCHASLKKPKLYWIGQEQQLFNLRVFAVTVLQALLTSLTLFFIPYGAFYNTAYDFQTFSVTVGTSAVFTVTAEIIQRITYWTRFNVLAIALCLILYFIMTFILQSAHLYRVAPQDFSFPGAAYNAFSHPYVWLTILLTVVVSILPALIVRALNKALRSPDLHRVHNSDMQVSYLNEVEFRQFFHGVPPRRRSSYAFSQHHGFGDLVTTMNSRETRSCEGVKTIPSLG